MNLNFDLQYFAEAGSVVNATNGYVNAGSGAREDFTEAKTLSPELKAFYALNRPRLDELAAARAAEASKALLARAVSGGAQRPREGGGSGAAALLRNDYAALSRPRQLALKQRIREAAARGEKMYP